MPLLTLEGFEVPVVPGTSIQDETWGDFSRAYSSKARSDRRASNRVIPVSGSIFDTSDDAVALRAILNTPGKVLAGGTMIGDDAYFHVRSVRMTPVTVDRLQFQFELHESAESPSPLLFSFDGDAPGSYTHTRSGTVGPRTNASGLLRNTAANVLRREHLWLDGTYAVATLPDTPAYLIEAARTNLVSSDNFDTGWSSDFSPVVTSGITDPAGGTSAYRIADDNAAAAEAKYIVVTFTGNAQKVVVFAVRQATMASSGFQSLVLHDATAIADRLRIFITAWSASGEPTLTASGGTGTLLGKRYLGNGYWAIYGLTTTVTATNENRAYIQPSDSSAAATGSIDVYRVNAYNATTPPWSILNASETKAVDTLYATAGFVPQELTVYLKFIEAGAVLDTPGGALFHIGAAGITTAERLTIQADGSGFYQAVHDDGAGNVIETLAAAPAFGDTVELLLQLSTAGIVFQQSINGATATGGSEATARPFRSSWGSGANRIYLNGPDTFGVGMNPIISAKIAKGSQSLAYMRDVARGRLHPRTADHGALFSMAASVAATSTTVAAESP